MSQKIQLRQENPEETEKMAQFESPDGDAICASYIDRSVADQLGEYAEVTVSDEADVNATLSKTTANYGVYETPGGAVTGLYISRDTLAEIAGDDEVPENIGLSFAPSSEDEFEEADAVDEDEIDGLLAGDSDDSDDDEPSAEDEAEEMVEISDEELDLEA
jgi:hypothetical protein